MAISFPAAPLVNVGDNIASGQLAGLAAAFNARLRSGLGDPTYRLWFWADSIARQVRNPDSGGFLWPSRSEWMEVYATINPVDYSWPITGPGDPEGANVGTPAGPASILPEYVFGSEANNTVTEDDRLLQVEMWATDHPPQTPMERWAVAKLQRGAYDPATGEMAAPCFDAARQHYRMLRSLNSPHGNSYGSFVPTPKQVDPPNDFCDSGDSENPPRPNFKIFFTKLNDPGKGTIYPPPDGYPGTCPGIDGHVASIYSFPPFSYVIGVWQAGTVVYDVLPFQDWIQGPYSGGNRLSKQNGNHLERVLNYFSSQFRGTTEQRIKNNAWNDYAFDSQEFFTRQYLVAPVKGTSDGAGGVNYTYPLHQKVGTNQIAAGTLLPAAIGGATSHTVAAGFVVAVVFVQCIQLSRETTVEILVNGAVVKRVTLTATQPEDIHVLGTPAIAGQTVAIRVATDTTFLDGAPGTGMAAEMAEIMDYKPWPHDHFLMLRMSGCRIDPFNGTDGYGIDETQSRKMGEDYFRWGMLQNVYGDASPPGSADAINSNAVHEAARRMLRCIRILRPEQLTGYEVQGGKSILYFDRWTVGAGGPDPIYGPGGSPPPVNQVQSGEIIANAMYQVWATSPVTQNDYVTYNGIDYLPDKTFRGVANIPDFTPNGTAKVFILIRYLMDSNLGGISGDTLAGIAPDSLPIPIGSIRRGRIYQVWASSGKVTYNGADYNNGQRFTGVKDVLGYTTTGDAQVYEADGIRHVAEPQSFTNEWLVGFQFKGFKEVEESLWKQDAYGRFFSFSERCHFYPNPNIPGHPLNPQARSHFAYGSRIWLAPEAPTGYRYALNLNQYPAASDQDERLAFYRSCRIYEPDLEIETAELVGPPESGQIKVTLKSRLHATDTAPASFGPDPNTWNSTALRGEVYRSVDNALREWLYYKATGINPSIKIGDAAWKSDVYSGFDAPYGTVLPHIFLTQLIPVPYADANDTQDEADTPFWHDTMQQMEMYLRVMCEGYVDGLTSAQYGCDTGIQALYDYTFENLCYDSFGGRWIPPLPSVATTLTSAANTRPDKPMGHGPLPNTQASAEVFNLFSRAINQLDTVRVMLPYSFEFRYLAGDEYQSVNAAQADGTSRDCSGSASFPGVIWTGTPPDASVSAITDWAEDPAGTNSGVVAEFNRDNNTPQHLVCDGLQWVIHTRRQDSDYRWKLVDPDAMEAIPPAWRDMVNTNGSFLALHSTTRGSMTVEESDPPGSDCNGSAGWWPKGNGKYLTFKLDNVVTSSCRLTGNGTISAPPVGSQTLPAGYSLGACGLSAGNNSEITPIPADGIAMTIPVV